MSFVMVTPFNPSSDTNATRVARALADHAESVAIALLGKPSSKSRNELRWGRHGSVAMRLSGAKRGLWCNFERGEGGDLLDLVARVHGVELREAIQIAERDYLGNASMRQPAPRRPWPSAPATTDDAEARITAARRVWDETVPLAGTLAERYFIKHRTLDVRLLDLDHALRWHAGIRAVVALMTDPVSNEPTGVHRTFLDGDGAKLERKMLGRQGVVRLSPDTEVTMGLGITEGIEDGLAVLLSGWAPVWAATSAGAVARFPVLAGIEALTIFADTDQAGRQAASTCAARWCSAGCEAVIAAPRRLTP
jgi:hypothetical protein